MGKILLCADTESLIRPILLGLDDEGLDGHDWLIPTSDAREARRCVSDGRPIDEAWVIACDGVAGTNLAAALRRDAPNLPIFMIAFDPNGSELSRAMQAGVTEVLGASEFRIRFSAERRRREMASEIGSLEIPSSGHQAEDRSIQDRPRYAPRGRAGFIVSVLSGSGGVGKSSICVLAACLCASRGIRTAIVDCDLQFGDVMHMMGGRAGLTVDDVLAEPERAFELAESAIEGLPAMICAPTRLERSEELSNHISELLDICADSFEAVFVNTGSSWSECQAQLIERSSVSLMLIDQRASSVRACQHALELCMRLGIASGSFVYALNRCSRGSLFSTSDISNAMQGAHVLELRDGGMEVEELLGAGLAHELTASGNELCESIDEMLDEMLPIDPGRSRRRKRGSTRSMSSAWRGSVTGSRRMRNRRKERRESSASSAMQASIAGIDEGVPAALIDEAGASR